jgi:hypothetical protein
MRPALGSRIGTSYAEEPMGKLGYVSSDVFCTALMLPATICADGSEAAGSASIPAGQSTEIERLKAQLEWQQRHIEEQQSQIRDLQLALEYQKAAYGKAIFYAYYGGIFVGRNTALDANGTTLIGYGYRGSPNSQNRTMQEITAGWNQTFYRDPKYSQVSTYLQHSYFWRNPWFVAPGATKNAFQNAVWFDVRYTLPGSAPAVGY